MDKTILFPTEDWCKVYLTVPEMEADLISNDGESKFVFSGVGWYSSQGDYMLVTRHPCGGYKVFVWNWNGHDPREDIQNILNMPFHKDF